MTTLRVGSATDVGRLRTINEDSSLVADRLYAVADGMGGHLGGEVASALAVETLRSAVALPTVDGLVQGVKLANRAIFERASTDPELQGMGTTLCAIALVDLDANPDGGDSAASSGSAAASGSGSSDATGDTSNDDSTQIAVANVGDSRVYLHRDGELVQLTHDHSLVEDLRQEGRITDEEAAVHPHRNILTRALGVDPEVEVDEFLVRPRPDDRFLLCSDGLFNEVNTDAISATLRRLADPGEVAADLVRQANENGGRDNITCVVVDVADPGDGADPSSTAAHSTVDAGTAAGAVDFPAATASAAAGRSDSPHDTGASAQARSVGTATGTATITGLEAEPEAPPTPGEPDAESTAEGEEPRHRRFTWRVALFILLLLAVFGAAVAAIGWYARRTYFVGYDNTGVVTIYQGRPGGFLWFDPTVEQRFPRLNQADVPQPYHDNIARRVDEGSVSDARGYVKNIESIVAQRKAAAVTPPAAAPVTPAVPAPPQSSAPPAGSPATPPVPPPSAPQP